MIGKEQFYLDDEGYSGPDEDVCRLDVSMRQSWGMRMPAIIHKALLTISTKEICCWWESKNGNLYFRRLIVRNCRFVEV